MRITRLAHCTCSQGRCSCSVDCGHCDYITISGLSDAMTNNSRPTFTSTLVSFNACQPPVGGGSPIPWKTRSIHTSHQCADSGTGSREPGLELLELARMRKCATEGPRKQVNRMDSRLRPLRKYRCSVLPATFDMNGTKIVTDKSVLDKLDAAQRRVESLMSPRDRGPRRGPSLDTLKGIGWPGGLVIVAEVARNGWYLEFRKRRSVRVNADS